MAEQQERNAPASSGERRQFEIQRLYVKNISLESPNAPQVFSEKWNPALQMDISNSVAELTERLFEVTLSVTVTVADADKTIYLAEVQQAGIFSIPDLPPDIRKHLLSTACPDILFPYARATVSDLVARAGFPQLLLAPINFDTLYKQSQQQQEAEEKPH